MTIYLDEDYRCHLDDGGGEYAPWEDQGGAFDGKCRAYIEGYRVVPEGQRWVREDGVAFEGLMIAPAVPYDTLAAAQALDEQIRQRLDEIEGALVELADLMLEGGV